MQIKPGARLRSATCDTQVVVVRGTGDLDLTCGGAPMLAADAPPAETTTPAAGHDGGTLLGKRYEDPSGSVEVLCVKPGAGTVGVGGVLLVEKAAKKLPASD
jgi:hypothetical protein